MNESPNRPASVAHRLVIEATLRERSGSALLGSLMAIPEALAALHEELSDAMRPRPPADCGG